MRTSQKASVYMSLAYCLKESEWDFYQGINFSKVRKGKEANISVVSFGADESAKAAIGEINKIEQYTTKKLAQNKQNSTQRTESTK